MPATGNGAPAPLRPRTRAKGPGQSRPRARSRLPAALQIWRTRIECQLNSTGPRAKAAPHPPQLGHRGSQSNTQHLPQSPASTDDLHSHRHQRPVPSGRTAMKASRNGKPRPPLARNSHWCLQGAHPPRFHTNHRLSLIQSLLRLGTVGTTGRVHSPLRSCLRPAQGVAEPQRVHRHRVPCIPRAHRTQRCVGA